MNLWLVPMLLHDFLFKYACPSVYKQINCKHAKVDTQNVIMDSFLPILSENHYGHTSEGHLGSSRQLMWKLVLNG